MNRRHGVANAPPERTAFVLDDCWPEYASMVAATRRPEDQFLAPGLWSGSPQRYAWPGGVRRGARFATLKRHFDMRRVARAPGNVRQAAYLRNDRAVTKALATHIDYRCGHLVVAQAWLPWLDEAGVLGGRSFDVLMSRYPLADMHRMLDTAAAEMPDAKTIRDFRAPSDLVERETRLLERARRIITPHHGIAELFAGKAVRLAWHRPPRVNRQPGKRVAFLGPTIARQRPDIVRSVAGGLDQPLIVFGDMLEQPSYWDGVPTERRAHDPGWLDGIGAILHPAAITNEPRRLLEAISAGIEVYATPGCGLAAHDYRPIMNLVTQPLFRGKQIAPELI
jgi:hypothetical protein